MGWVRVLSSQTFRILITKDKGVNSQLEQLSELLEHKAISASLTLNKAFFVLFFNMHRILF